MRVLLCGLTLTATGCSTAPVTNLLDHFFPSRYEAKGGADDRGPLPPRLGPAEPGIFPAQPDGRLGEPFPAPGSRN